MRRPRFFFSPIALVVTLVAAAVCLRLSWWQLERADQKQAWLAQQAKRAEQPPLSLEAARNLPSPEHYRIRVQGQLDNRHSVLLDNRIHKGVAGYYLLTPMQTDDNQWVLVNRGWLPRGRDRDQLPEIPKVGGTIGVTGTLYRPSSKTIVLKDTPLPDNQWPLRVQKVDFAAIGEKLGVELAPFEIRALPGLALHGATPLPRPWQTVTTLGPERHRAYALQWFALAVAAVVVFLVAGFSLGRRKTGKR